MATVAVITGAFIIAGLAMISKLGIGNSAKLEAAIAHPSVSARKSDNVYMHQFEEAVGSRH